MGGAIRFFNSIRGYGFIAPEEGDTDVYFHISEVENGQHLRVGDLVTFNVQFDKRNRPRASQVRLVESSGRESPSLSQLAERLMAVEALLVEKGVIEEGEIEAKLRKIKEGDRLASVSSEVHGSASEKGP